jgi:thiol-disulfide isomerase/thioredoxin
MRPPFFRLQVMNDTAEEELAPGPAARSARRRLLLAAVGGLAWPLVPAAQSAVRWTDIELIDGRTLSAADLRSGAVVAQIWASWCPFCAAQNPHVQKLHEAQTGRGLRVVAFSIDKTVEAARDYVTRRGYTFPVAMATPQLDAWFGKRRTLPETYVVDRAGVIVFRHQGEMFPEDIAALARFAGK